MLSVSSGHSAAYLTDQVAVGRESYYLDATTDGEPAGRWWGEGAEAFGLTGEVDNDQMHALYADFLDPRDERWADPETRAECARLGRAPARYRSADEILAERLEAEPGALPERVEQLRREAERAERQPVSFMDATYSPQKSVTVLHTAYARAELDAQRAGDAGGAELWSARRRAVEDAIWEGNQAMLAYLADTAGYSRAGKHSAGTGRWIDAHDWTVASFFQHTSRDLDPQLHIHNAILNRVVCSDGETRTLDGQSIYAMKQAAGTIADRTMEEALSVSLGVRWQMRADGIGREIAGVDQAAMDMFSERTAKISRSLQVKVDELRAHFGREPSAFELDKMRRQATMATRKAKTHSGEMRGEQLDRWDETCREELAGGLRRIAETVGGAAPVVEAAEWSPSGVIAEAIASVQQTRAAWSRSELTRQILLALPDHLGGLNGDQVRKLADGLTDEALRSPDVVQVTGNAAAAVPAELQLADGRSVYAAPGGPRYAGRAHVVAEQALRRAAVEGGRRAAAAANVDRWLTARDTAGTPLGADQAAAVRGLLTSGAAVSVLVGPAGTGKSFTVGALAQAWASPGVWGGRTTGRLVGLATQQIATEVLADEGLDALNTSQWLGAQRRMADGTASTRDRLWALSDADAVVVDEASMVDTADLEEIRGYVELAGARLILTGDPRQLAAVGAGGGMAMLADDAADVHTLAEVRRFSAAWEREASLRLRDGDQEVLAEYDRRGRVRDCGTPDQAGQDAARAYLGDTLAGLSSLVITPTNQQAAAVSAIIRDELVALGRVEAAGVILGRDGNTGSVGDLVQARRNDYGIGVTNRRRYTVTEVREDGSLIVEPEGGGARRTLPASYVGDHVSLAYASTAHSAQGVTVDTGHCIASAQMSPEGLYVAMSRGRSANTAHVATLAEKPGEATGETHERIRRSADAVLADVLNGDQAEATALDQAAQDARDAASMRVIHGRYEEAMRYVGRARTEGWLDRLAADGVLTETERAAFAADQGTEQLSRLLRGVELAGSDPETALREAVAGKTLDGARSVAQVVHHRIASAYSGEGLRPVVEHTGDTIPPGVPEDWRAYLGELAEAADARRRALGAETAEAAPQWATEALGPVPTDVLGRAEWEHRAGIVAAYREADGHTDEAAPIGSAPGQANPEKRAAWQAAWTVLGRPEAGTEEQDLTDGALRARIRAREAERAWAPPHVGAQQKATGQAVARHRQHAALLGAQAEAAAAAGRADEAEQLRAEAAGTAALADVMAQTEARLAEAAEARAAWHVETAVTEEKAQRAVAELKDRGRSIGDEDDRTTAEEWLRAHDEAARAEDPHREITEPDILDSEAAEAEPEADAEPVKAEPRAAQPDAGAQSGAAGAEAEPEAEPIRAADEAAGHDGRAEAEPEAAEAELPPGVPSVAETDAAAAAAQLAAERLADRRSAEAAHAASERTAQAAAGQAAREAAWRAQDQRQAERTAAEAADSDALGV